MTSIPAPFLPIKAAPVRNHQPWRERVEQLVALNAAAREALLVEAVETAGLAYPDAIQAAKEGRLWLSEPVPRTGPAKLWLLPEAGGEAVLVATIPRQPLLETYRMSAT